MKPLLAFIRSDAVLPFLVSLIICLVLFWPTVIQRQLPIATDLLTGFHQPWRTLHFEGSPFPFPVKNVESFDTVRAYYPWRFMAIEQYKQGQLPLWNSSQLSGTPLAAEFVSGAFYPFNIIFWMMSFEWAWAILAISQVYLAIILMYYFLRSEKIGQVASLFGGIVFSLSGFMAAFFHSNTMNHALMWTPLGLLAINKLFTTNNRLWSIVLAIAVTGIALASHVQILLYSYILFFAYAVFQWYRLKTGTAFLWSTIGLVVGVCISGLQLLPTLELIQLSSRIGNFSRELENGFSPWYHLLLLAIPNYLGNPGRQNYFFDGSYYHEFSFYVGIPTLLFAFLALPYVKRNLKIGFWFLVAVVAFVIAIDNPLSQFAYALNIPFFASVTPTRTYAYLDTALPVLSAYGINLIITKQIQKRWLGLSLFIGAIGLVFVISFMNVKNTGIFFLKYLFDDPVNNATAMKSLLIPAGLFGITTMLGAILVWAPRRLVVGFSLAVLFSLTFFDLQRQFFMQNPFVPEKSVFPPTKMTAYLSSFPIPARIIETEDSVMTPGIGAYYGFEHIDGYDPNHSKKFAETFIKYDASFSGQPKAFGKMISITEPKSYVVDLLSADYIFDLFPIGERVEDPKYVFAMKEGDVYMYENADAPPRFRLSQELLKSTSDISLLKTKSLVYPSGNAIYVNNYSPNKVELIVSSNQPQNLETLIVSYPGWHTVINGKSVPTQTNEDGFVMAPVTQGTQTVTFSYFPNSFLFGSIMSVLGIMVCVGIGLLPKRLLPLTNHD